MIWRRFKNLSGVQLVLPVLGLTLLVSGLLTVYAVLQARATDIDKLQIVGDRLVDRMRESHLAVVGKDIRELSNTWPLDAEDLSVGLWRRLDGKEDHIASFPSEDVWSRRPDGSNRKETIFDLAIISKSENWEKPMNSLLRVAIAHPARNERAVRGVLPWFWAGYAILLVASALVYLHYQKRFQQSAAFVKSSLEDFASGDTNVRLQESYAVPEITQVAALVNPILGRLQTMIQDMQHVTEHAAHELNRPIKKAQVHLKSADERGEDLDPALLQTYFSEAIANVNLVATLIRLDAERGLPTTQSTVDFSDLLSKRVEVNEGLLTRYDRRLNENIVDDIFLCGEDGLLEILVDNLLNNIDKYAPHNSDLCISLNAGDHSFRFAVSNTGAFPVDIRDCAFEPYKRSEVVWSSTPGMGIGLSIVHRIAERHGFSVNITPSDKVAEVVIEGPVTDRTSLT